MEISIRYQLLTTLYSSILGVFIGLIYDYFKTFRKFILGEISLKLQDSIKKINFPLIKLSFNNNKVKLKHKITYFIVDLLFFVSIIPIMQIFVYAFSNGIVRWYIFFGVIIGFICYYFTLSKIILFVYEICAVIIKIFFKYFLFFVEFPMKKIKVFVLKKYINLKNKIKKENEKSKIDKTNQDILFQTGKKQNHRLW